MGWDIVEMVEVENDCERQGGSASVACRQGRS